MKAAPEALLLLFDSVIVLMNSICKFLQTCTVVGLGDFSIASFEENAQGGKWHVI